MRSTKFLYSVLTLIIFSFSVNAASLTKQGYAEKRAEKKAVTVKENNQASNQQKQQPSKNASISHYSSQSKTRIENTKAQSTETQNTAQANKQNNQQQTTIYRKQTPLISNKSDDFSIHDAWFSLDQDDDGDGYFSEFTLSFDADFNGASADVYAEIYIATPGGAWQYLTETEVFTIFSDEADEFILSLQLNFDYPTGDYDFLIDLYQAGAEGIVATLDDTDDVDLSRQPLEDKEHELVNPATIINYVATELSYDEDFDGYYTRMSLEFDVETIDSGRLVFAGVMVTDSETLESAVFATNDFFMGNQTEIIDIDFVNDFYPSLYDVEIRLLDAITEEVLVYAAQDFSALTKLPIESEDYDYQDDAGSFGVLIGWLLLILIVIRFLSEDKPSDGTDKK